MKMNVLGKEITIRDIPDDRKAAPEKSPLIMESVALLQEYARGFRAYDEKVVSNEQWFKLRHWEEIRNEAHAGDPEPVTGILMNTIMNKHAEAMDFLPTMNILPRDGDDEEEAKQLSKILPVEFEYLKFKDIWEKMWWEKLKHGCAIYAILYDPDGLDGIGSGSIQIVDGLRFFHKPGINDLQESPSVFVTEVIDVDQLKLEHPDIDIKKATKVFQPKDYAHDDNFDDSTQTVLVDRYYKKRNTDGKMVLHYVQFVGEVLLYSSEDDPLYAEGGFYEHGNFPFVIDVLFPEKGNIRGFGIIDLLKSPQVYVDKLDQIIIRNAFTTGRTRYLVNKGASINEEELLDLSKDIVHFDGSIQEEAMFRELKTNGIAHFIPNHRQLKIEEMKETSGTSDFNRGETNKGVTAASAIIALQQANSKIGRDMIGSSYSKFSQVVYQYIEIMRQYYTQERSYRIKTGNKQGFVKYNNKRIVLQPTKTIGEKQLYRKPVFDVTVVPEKQDPFSRAAHNEMAKELFNLGAFSPDRFLEARVMLEMMEFEGKEKIIDELERNDKVMQALQQMQQLIAENEKLKYIVQQLTGEDMGVNPQIMRDAYGQGKGQSQGQSMVNPSQGPRKDGNL